MAMSKDKDQAYWEAKHPASDVPYSGRPMPHKGSLFGGTDKAVNQDVRSFIWDREFLLQRLAREIRLGGPQDQDSIAQRCQQWVVSNIQYVSDETLGASEYWLYPIELIALGKGDCEDGANLMASLMVMAGVDRWRARPACGPVVGGNHCYLTYCCELDNEFRILDWCYWEDSEVPVWKKPLIPLNEKYFGGEKTWFSYTIDRAYSHQQTSVKGRIRKGVQ
jgi:hypothetical protein